MPHRLRLIKAVKKPVLGKTPLARQIQLPIYESTWQRRAIRGG